MSSAPFDGQVASKSLASTHEPCEVIQKRECERYVFAPVPYNCQPAARTTPDWYECCRPVATKLVNDFAPAMAPSKANQRPRQRHEESPRRNRNHHHHHHHHHHQHQVTQELASERTICDLRLECDFHWQPTERKAAANWSDASGQTALTRQPINQQAPDPAGRRVMPRASASLTATDADESSHHRTKTRRAGQQMGACQTASGSQLRCTHMQANKHQRHNGWLSAATVRWQLIQIALIYTLLTSDSLKIAQATTASTNYWPLVHQHRYQQLLFTGRMQPERQHQPTQEDELEPRMQSHRRLLGPLRPQHQSQAAAAAAAAAIAATASAAQARKSQSHNLLIGQNYNNFSSIIPYSLMQDVDYPAMPEDPLINEQDMPRGASLDLEPHSDIDEVKASDSVPILDDGAELGGQHHLPMHQATSTQTLVSSNSMAAKVLAQLTGPTAAASASERAILDSNRLILPQMQQIKARFNQGCVGGTKCQFFAFCWMSGGSLGASCGLLMTCCVTPSRQEIQPGFYGPVVNDPYCGRSTSKINRIVGGTDASFGQFPWQAFVQVGGSRCGGALISSRHVVTAGHCVARSQHSPSSIKVTLGDYILNSDIESIPHEVYSVVEVLLHPNFRFTPQADRYDVAVLELDRAASYKDNIKPICLPQKDATFVGRVAYVAGWGALQAGSKLRPKVLQHVAVPVIENQVCESWHRRKGIDIRIYDEMMCAGYELGQRDACQGDSGGPLMLNQFGVWYLVGIVSAGYSCAKQYQPGIYHRVSSSSDWISSNVYQQGNSK